MPSVRAGSTTKARAPPTKGSIETTDTVATIEQHVGVVVSAYELIEEYPFCIDVVYVLDQAGAGLEMLVPTEEGIDPALIAAIRGTP